MLVPFIGYLQISLDRLIDGPLASYRTVTIRSLGHSTQEWPMGLGTTQGSHCSAWTEKFLVGGRSVGDFHVKKTVCSLEVWKFSGEFGIYK